MQPFTPSAPGLFAPPLPQGEEAQQPQSLTFSDIPDLVKEQIFALLSAPPLKTASNQARLVNREWNEEYRLFNKREHLTLSRGKSDGTLSFNQFLDQLHGLKHLKGLTIEGLSESQFRCLLSHPLFKRLTAVDIDLDQVERNPTKEEIEDKINQLKKRLLSVWISIGSILEKGLLSGNYEKFPSLKERYQNVFMTTLDLQMPSPLSQDFPLMPELSQLRELHLRFRISQVVIAKNILKNCPNLTHLTLTTSLYQLDTNFFSSASRSLKKLSVNFYNQDEGALALNIRQAIKQALPRLEQLALTDSGSPS
ncbi:MAG: hypothetical protein K0S07_702 [Chlamydiales bacterium]|jgi:hypothetical protein|nr:hypothetical protein [Chlamydiales bacterium]